MDWLFRNRETGRLTIVQAPNEPLLLFLVALVLRRVLHLSGAADAALASVAVAALMVWGVLEVVRGVNPWRRVLGGGVLVWQILGLVLR